MTPPAGHLPVHKYLVTYSAGDHAAADEVEASYIQEEGALVMLKGRAHEIVYAVPTHRLLVVQRGKLVA